MISIAVPSLATSPAALKMQRGIAVLTSKARCGRGLVRAVSSDAVKAGKPKREQAVPRDKSAISPMRGFFYGDLSSYHKHCVPFPTVLDADGKATLKQLVDPVQQFFGAVDSTRIDREENISDPVMNGLKELGLFGLQIPEDLGGLGLNNTSFARVVEEFTDSSIAVTLLAHQSIGLKGILLCGTPEQKAKYLPRLATGEHIAAFALTEPGTGSDAASIKLTATPVAGGGYALNGQKMWISNGGWASVYTVFARTPVEGGAPGETKVTAFIVERAFGGISPGPPEHKLGIRGSNTVVLNFENCVVPKENVLGEVGGGFKVAVTILNSGRFGMGAGTAGGIKKLIGLAGEYANTRVQFGHPIASYGLIQQKFANMAADAYAIESMVYATTALIDTVRVADPYAPAAASSSSSGSGSGALVPMDCSLEAAACKVYGSEAMFRAVNDALQVLGGMGFSAGHPYERYLRDARILLIFEGTNEILRLFIALTALAGPGAELAALGKALQSGSPAAAAHFASAWLAETWGIGGPRVEGIAPALAAQAAALGSALTSFRGAVRSLLIAHGRSILEPQHQMQLARLADCAIDLYAWSCTLSRASAAVKGGAPHVEHELRLARMVSAGADARIRAKTAEVRAGERKNGDAELVAAAKEILGAGRYLAEHPLRV